MMHGLDETDTDTDPSAIAEAVARKLLVANMAAVIAPALYAPWLRVTDDGHYPVTSYLLTAADVETVARNAVSLAEAILKEVGL